jgi:hypothetical protein
MRTAISEGMLCPKGHFRTAVNRSPEAIREFPLDFIEMFTDRTAAVGDLGCVGADNGGGENVADPLVEGVNGIVRSSSS